MYWGQISLAAASAMGTGYLLHARGRTLATAVLAALVVYFTVRWTIAWAYRVRYWYRRGTRGVQSENCGNCGGYVYRHGGNWILSCHRCGWTAGLPVLRWFTRSVPVRQLRRTVVGPQLLVVVLAVGLLTTGVAGQMAVDDISVNMSGSAVSGDPLDTTNERPAQSEVTSTPTETPERGYNKTKAEAWFIRFLNEERSERGLQNVSQRGELTEMGEVHAAKMAELEYVGHEWPDGTTIEDRYRQRGLLPECRLPIQGSDRYYAGAENAVQVWVDQDMRMEDGTEHVTNERELGHAIFRNWMNSPPHRKAMLVASADQAGLGLNITESGKVYGALELC